MAHYYYSCEKCKKVTDDFRNMDDRNNVSVCEDCGGEVKRDIETECKKTVMKSGENIRNSRSLAMSVADIKSGKADEAHPGANWGAPNRAGMCPMVIHDRREKLKRIKERGRSMGTPLTEM